MGFFEAGSRPIASSAKKQPQSGAASCLSASLQVKKDEKPSYFVFTDPVFPRFSGGYIR